MKKIQNILLTIFVFISGAWAAVDTTAVQSFFGGSISGINDMLTIILSSFAIFTVLKGLGKKIFSESELEKRIKQTEAEVIQLKNQLTVNHDEMKTMFESIKQDLSYKASKDKNDQLSRDHVELEETVTNGIDKLNGTINELALVEHKLNEMKKYFDEKNSDRKEEINEINETIKSLRETVRDEVNSVKDVMLKMMYKLHE